jgi:hypothetical protein
MLPKRQVLWVDIHLRGAGAVGATMEGQVLWVVMYGLTGPRGCC